MPALKYLKVTVEKSLKRFKLSLGCYLLLAVVSRINQMIDYLLRNNLWCGVPVFINDLLYAVSLGETRPHHELELSH